MSTNSYPDDNPKTEQGAKKLPLHLVPPSVVAYLATAFADGGAKYGPYNWRAQTISSEVYYAAAKRHMDAWWDGEDYAEDSGVHHLAHAMACFAMLLDAESIGKLNDNRPPKGAFSSLLKKLVESLEGKQIPPIDPTGLYPSLRQAPISSTIREAHTPRS